MKRGWALTAAILLLSLATVPAQAQVDGTSIREVDLEGFPAVDVVVSTGEVEAGPNEITLREDGRPRDATVTPLGEERSVDVVLVLDASGSMQGAPLGSAISAASAFIDGLPDQIRVAIVTFSDEPQVAQGFTRDRSVLLNVIRGVRASGETALNDAVVRAAGLFSEEAQRNLIVLSDGGDTSSSASLKTALDRAERSGAAVFTVGLESGEFDPKALRALSQVNDGRYATADTADLGSIYEGLAAGLKNQFLISYESDVAPGSQLSLTVQGPYGADSRLMLAPQAVDAPTAENGESVPQPAPVADPLVSGGAGLGLVIILVFASAFLLFFALGRSASETRRDRSLARRFGAGDEDEDPDGNSAWLPESVIDASERFASKTRFGINLGERLERAGTPLKTGEFLATSILASIVGAMVGRLLFSSFLVAAIAALSAAAVPHLFVSMKLARRQKRIQAQLADVLSVMASSLRAGHSFLQSLNMVAQQVPEPGASEFARVVAEVRLGRPIDESLDALADRIGSPDFRWAVMAVNIQREAGGNLAEVFDSVANTLRERDVLRRQVDVLSAEGRMSMVILTVLPVGLGLYLLLVNPTYVSLLWTTSVGLVMLAVGSGLLLLGQIWMKRVVKIDV